MINYRLLFIQIYTPYLRAYFIFNKNIPQRKKCIFNIEVQNISN